MPDDRLLAESRAPMVLLAAATGLLLYALGRVVAGTVAGLMAAGLALGSPLAQGLLVRAAPEALLACCLLLSLLLGVLGTRRGPAGGLPIGWAVGLGAALGLGIGAKLTVLLSLAAILGWGALMAALTASRYRRAGLGASMAHAWSAGRGWGLAAVIALAVFVLGNPHLYPNPALHAAHIFQQVEFELAEAQLTLPLDAVYDPLERPVRVLEGSLVSGTAIGSRGLPLEAVLAVIGAVSLVAAVWRAWRETGRVPVQGLVLLTACVYFAGTSAGLYLAWPRYYIPTLLLGTLFSAVGFATAIRKVAAAIPRSTPSPRAASSGHAAQ